MPTYGDLWLDLQSRPFVIGRVRNEYAGGFDNVELLIDTGSMETSIPVVLMDSMKLLRARDVEIRRQHKTVIEVPEYDNILLQFPVLSGDGKMFNYTYAGTISGQLDERHGVLGMNALEAAQIRVIEFDYVNWTVQLKH